MRSAAAIAAFRLLAHPLESFHPARMPVLSRRNYRRELVATGCFSLALAMLEGGLIAVLVKNAFAGVVRESLLHYAVAILAAAPEFANLTSFLWASVSHGLSKVRFINTLQIGVIAIVAAVSFVPRSDGGLLLLGAGVIAARVCMTGVVTLRATVWRANYPRSDRARATGKLAILQSIVVGAAGAALGAAMDWSPDSFRIAFPVAAAMGLVGVHAYSRVRVRRQRRMIRVERAEGGRGGHGRPSLNPVSLWHTLRADRGFAWFMLSMFVLGSGNLMLTAPLVITLRDEFHQGYLGGIAVMQTMPYLMMPLAIPLWARFLDRVHIVRFRSVHSWVFVAAQSLVLLGALSHSLWLMYASAAVLGVAYAGGALAWNLGHLDFAPAHKASQYMGVHVTLNGLRGLIAPLVAVTIYDALDAARAGQWVFGISVVLCIAGATGFVLQRRAMGERAERRPEERSHPSVRELEQDPDAGSMEQRE